MRPSHSEKAFITERYLKHRRALVNQAYDRLAAANVGDGELLEQSASSTLAAANQPLPNSIS